MPSTGYITAVQAAYDALTGSNFPGGSRWPGPYLDEAPTTDGAGSQVRPPYVVLRDLGATPEWTFTANAGSGTPGQHALVVAEFVIEAHALTLGDCDTAMAAILWNGAVPNNRAGVAFATFTLTTPLKGVSGPVPGKSQRGYAGKTDRTGARVHYAKQWFKVKTAISGDGL